MKEMKLEIPAYCEVDKIETQDGHIVVTFKEKERKLPKSWEEFCEMYPIQPKESFIDEMSIVTNALSCAFNEERETFDDRNLLPDRATAEAVLALCQLIQLRNCYNGDWVPDWSERTEIKYCIDFAYGEICNSINYISPLLLYFKTEELRDEFLRCFRPLIEKLRPLYGIKEGGEE